MSIAKSKLAYNLERLYILVVDDNWHMRALVRSILESLGVKNILDAGDGADALKELRDFSADMIICDLSMSPLDGLEFARLIRTGANSPDRYVPIIMLTGHTEMNRVIACRDAGVNEYLAKPISPKGLYDRICEIIENPREFIDIKDYMGPDRRRRADPKYGGPDRREDKPAGQPAADAGEELDQDDVDALLNG